MVEFIQKTRSKQTNEQMLTLENDGLKSLLTLVAHTIIEMTDDIKRKEKHEVKTDDFGNVTEEKHEVEEED